MIRHEVINDKPFIHLTTPALLCMTQDDGRHLLSHITITASKVYYGENTFSVLIEFNMWFPNTHLAVRPLLKLRPFDRSHLSQHCKDQTGHSRDRIQFDVTPAMNATLWALVMFGAMFFQIPLLQPIRSDANFSTATIHRPGWRRCKTQVGIRVKNSAAAKFVTQSDSERFVFVLDAIRLLGEQWYVDVVSKNIRDRDFGRDVYHLLSKRYAGGPAVILAKLVAFNSRLQYNLGNCTFEQCQSSEGWKGVSVGSQDSIDETEEVDEIYKECNVVNG